MDRSNISGEPGPLPGRDSDHSLSRPSPAPDLSNISSRLEGRSPSSLEPVPESLESVRKRKERNMNLWSGLSDAEKNREMSIEGNEFKTFQWSFTLRHHKLLKQSTCIKFAVNKVARTQQNISY